MSAEQAIRLAAPAIKPDTSINIAAAVKSKLMRRLSSGKHFTTNNKSCHDGKDASISSAAKLSLTLGLGGGGTGDLQSIGALVVIVRELCEGYEDLKRRYEELQGRYQTFEGYRVSKVKMNCFLSCPTCSIILDLKYYQLRAQLC